ncbi:hypothetical protein [Streptomyces sp. NBC_00154]|uniref:hypothetical protein n=1 Tax=Streptomyces sp. NBC_00154 TaxID=2975670 RepID=UPI00225AD802|nr:hypothetical protein [Streptomyces sp. NBC_00154]MCX5314743.1 hypothetical protein [Streptomyces sp. NBC_00154]
MSEHEGTPRSLRISFEFEVPRGLKGVNIPGASVQKALDTMADRIIGLSESLFPWAGKVAVRKQWVYHWTDCEETIQLPANDKNTPK